MRRRLIIALLACVALAAPASAIAQTPSTSTPASTTTPVVTSPPASTTAPAPATTPATTSTPASTTTPASSGGPETSSSSHTGAWILLGAVGAVLLLLAIAWGAARWWAWEPRWIARTRHATAEAGWRTGAAWAEFRDWLRLGR